MRLLRVENQVEISVRFFEQRKNCFEIDYVCRISYGFSRKEETFKILHVSIFTNDNYFILLIAIMLYSFLQSELSV